MDTTEETTTTEATEATSTETTTRTRPSGTPPAKPGEDSNSSTENTEMNGTPPDMCDESDEDCEMPEPPTDGEFSGGPGMMQDASTSSSDLHPAAYLSMGAGSLILAMAISYACFSKFFHKKPGETFDKKSKFIWCVVVSLILATALCVLCYFIPTWIK